MSPVSKPRKKSSPKRKRGEWRVCETCSGNAATRIEMGCGGEPIVEHFHPWHQDHFCGATKTQMRCSGCGEKKQFPLMEFEWRYEKVDN